MVRGEIWASQLVERNRLSGKFRCQKNVLAKTWGVRGARVSGPMLDDSYHIVTIDRQRELVVQPTLDIVSQVLWAAGVTQIAAVPRLRGMSLLLMVLSLSFDRNFVGSFMRQKDLCIPRVKRRSTNVEL